MSSAIVVNWAKWDLVEWWEGCVGKIGEETVATLTIAEEGLYARICNYMYRTGGVMTADVLEGARLMRVNHNQYRVTRQALIDKGFSQADVARELGVTRQAIQKMLAC